MGRLHPLRFCGTAPWFFLREQGLFFRVRRLLWTYFGMTSRAK